VEAMEVVAHCGEQLRGACVLCLDIFAAQVMSAPVSKIPLIADIAAMHHAP
jgi:hypothetical protein